MGDGRWALNVSGIQVASTAAAVVAACKSGVRRYVMTLVDTVMLQRLEHGRTHLSIEQPFKPRVGHADGNEWA